MTYAEHAETTQNFFDTDKPQQRRSSDRPTQRMDGFAPHDDFQPPKRRPGLMILDYEEGESI